MDKDLSKIKGFLKEKCQIDLKNDYDALLIKKLVKSNLPIKENGSTSNQSHIALTKKEDQDFFPYIYIRKYIEDEVKIMKSFYYLQVPIKIFNENVRYASKSKNISFPGKNSITLDVSIKYSFRADSTRQLELANTSQSDEYFKEYRKCMSVDDYLVILKLKNKVEYESFIVKSQDGDSLGLKSKTEFQAKLLGNGAVKTSQQLRFNKPLFPKNWIYYGAPGTGKSYILNQNAQYFEERIRRVTFHPSIMHSDFVGTYKPVATLDNESQITYKYIAGPFLKSLIDAIVKPNEDHLLIIEELNRGNVSSVFGEMFQLLDRDFNGTSEYPIDISEDIMMYINENVFLNSDISEDIKENVRSKLSKGLIIPSNFYIWATMNPADQGVQPLDTAFKRRWDFKYLSINHSFDESIFKEFSLIKLGTNKKVKWDDMRRFLNNELSKLNIPEDRLLGPYFLSRITLESSEENLTNTFVDKVLMYLFEDIGVQFRSKIFNVSKLRLSEIREQFLKNGETIFNNYENFEGIINVGDKNNEVGETE